MSVQTEADEHLASAGEHVSAAVEHIAEVVIRECRGTKEFKREYLDRLRGIMLDLIAMKRDLT